MHLVRLLLPFSLLLSCAGGPGGEPAGAADGGSLPDAVGPPPGGNQPPELARVGDKEALVGETLEIVLEATDPEGEAVTYSAYGDLPPDAKFFKGDAHFTWTPAAPGGPWMVTFVASDGKAFDSETVSFRAVTEKENHAPELVDPGDQFPAAGVPYALRIQATDQDGDGLTYGVQGVLPAGALFDAAAAELRWTPGADQVGQELRVTFAVSDGQLKDSLDVRFVVTGGAGGNQPPVFATIPSQEVSVGKTLVLTVQATDPDGDPLAYGVEDAPPGSAWDAAGHTLTFTPAAGVANQSFTPTFSASDGTFTVTKQAAILVKAGGAPATCSPDAFEPNEDKAAAAKLNPGLFQGLSICDPDASSFDADWFSLQLTAGTHLTATITFSHDHGDLGLGLFAATGQQALALSDGVSDLESVATTVPAAGTFYLVVFAKAGVNLKVPYSLEINAAAGGGCSADLLEPNDSLAEALPLLPEDFVDGIRICPGDEDWFSLDLTAGESLIATIDFPVDKDLDLYLYGPAGQSLDSSLSGAGLETVAVDPAPATGTYAVKVVGWPPESTQADYSLEVMASTCPACDGDWKEPNDSQGQAGLLVPGQAVQDLTICCDADWFQFNVSQGKQVQVELEYATDALTKPSVALTLPATAAVPLPCGPDTCLGGSVAGTAGTAYLQVTGPANTWYEVLVTVSGAAAGDSCAGHCDDQAPGGCWCDGTCLEYNDCCDDVCDACPAVCG